MAHVSMHQYTSRADLGEMLADYGKQRRSIAQSERESRRSAGVALQTNQSRLDNEKELAKIHETNQLRIARMKAGFDLQMKQMGVDAELLLQKMRNMNAEQIEMLRRKTSEIIENLADEHKQAQILQMYKTNLALAKYNAKTAMLRTFNEVMGDIYKTGNPLDNAADAAAYGLWVFAFRKALNMFGLNDMMERVDPADNVGTLDGKKVTLNSNTQEEEDEFEKAVREILKNGGKSKPVENKITRYPKMGFKTKVKMYENLRAGRPWEQRGKKQR